MEDYIVIEFPVCGGEIGTLDELTLIPLSNHVADILRVLVLYEHNSVNTTLPMMCDIHQAKDCVDTVLCGLLIEINILEVSDAMEYVLAK